MKRMESGDNNSYRRGEDVEDLRNIKESVTKFLVEEGRKLGEQWREEALTCENRTEGAGDTEQGASAG